jgi:hypothetical protein
MMEKQGRPYRTLGAPMLFLALLTSPNDAPADYFSLYLKCEGAVTSRKGNTRAHVDLALRDNNETALIQRSNVLPVGGKMKYEVSPATYSMTYFSPGARTQLYYDWYQSYLFRWDPNLKRLAAVRLSIDRQTGQLDGDLVNSQDESLARIRMACEAITPEELPEPKF